MNVGTIDRLLRFVLGFGLIGYGLYFALSLEPTANPQAVWGFVALGAVFFATAVLAICPLYRALGLSTRAA